LERNHEYRSSLAIAARKRWSPASDTATDAMIRYAGAFNATADDKGFKGYKP